jgi:hypothetical protein
MVTILYFQQLRLLKAAVVVVEIQEFLLVLMVVQVVVAVRFLQVVVMLVVLERLIKDLLAALVDQHLPMVLVVEAVLVA